MKKYLDEDAFALAYCLSLGLGGAVEGARRCLGDPNGTDGDNVGWNNVSPSVLQCLLEHIAPPDEQPMTDSHSYLLVEMVTIFSLDDESRYELRSPMLPLSGTGTLGVQVVWTNADRPAEGTVAILLGAIGSNMVQSMHEEVRVTLVAGPTGPPGSDSSEQQRLLWNATSLLCVPTDAQARALREMMRSVDQNKVLQPPKQEVVMVVTKPSPNGVEGGLPDAVPEGGLPDDVSLEDLREGVLWDINIIGTRHLEVTELASMILAHLIPFPAKPEDSPIFSDAVMMLSATKNMDRIIPSLPLAETIMQALQGNKSEFAQTVAGACMPYRMQETSAIQVVTTRLNNAVRSFGVPENVSVPPHAPSSPTYAPSSPASTSSKRHRKE